MFSLIVVLVSIVIVGALILAVVYYGGDAFRSGGTKAAVARIHNEGTQIASSAKLYQVNHGDYAKDIGDLVSGNYLSAAPGLKWEVYQDSAVLNDMPQDQCVAINAAHNITGIPSCDDPVVAGNVVCCASAN